MCLLNKGRFFLYADSQCLLWNSGLNENSDLSIHRDLLILNFSSVYKFFQMYKVQWLQDFSYPYSFKSETQCLILLLQLINFTQTAG